MTKDPKDLTLDDLFGDDPISDEELEQISQDLKQEKQEKEKESAVQKLAREILNVPDFFRAECRVILWIRAYCSQCNGQFNFPGAENQLIRFRHRKKHSTTWYKTPSSPLDKQFFHLPLEEEKIYKKLTECPYCSLRKEQDYQRGISNLELAFGEEDSTNEH